VSSEDLNIKGFSIDPSNDLNALMEPRFKEDCEMIIDQRVALEEGDGVEESRDPRDGRAYKTSQPLRGGREDAIDIVSMEHPLGAGVGDFAILDPRRRQHRRPFLGLHSGLLSTKIVLLRH
jgi:hypothetical protein